MYHRTPHLLGFFFSRRRVAARDAHRARGALGYPAVALLDRDGVYGAPQFYRAAKAAGLKAIVGAELTIRRAARSASRRPVRGARAVDAARARRVGRGLSQSLPPDHAREARAPKGEIVPAAGRSRRATRRDSSRWSAARRWTPNGTASAGWSISSSACSDATQVWIELQRHFRRDEQGDHRSRCIDLAAAFRVPVMASNGVRFATPEARPLYDVLTCIRHKTTLERGGAAADGERRAVSEAAGADGAAVRAICRRRWPAPKRWPSGSSSRSRISATGFRTIPCRRARRRCRFCGGWRRSARAIATGRITIARGRRSRASSI